jgi:hypothetical protein
VLTSGGCQCCWPVVLIVLASGAGQWGLGRDPRQGGHYQKSPPESSENQGAKSPKMCSAEPISGPHLGPAWRVLKLALLTQFCLGPCPFSGSENSTSVVSLLADHLWTMNAGNVQLPMVQFLGQSVSADLWPVLLANGAAQCCCPVCWPTWQCKSAECTLMHAHS